MLIVTVKPGLGSEEKVRRLATMGVTGFRVNFGRMQMQDNMRLLRQCRQTVRQAGSRAVLLADLPGQKSRFGRFEKGTVDLQEGMRFSIFPATGTLGDGAGAEIEGSVYNCINPGDRLMTTDRSIVLEVMKRTEGAVQCVVRKSGRLYNRCGVLIEGRYVPSCGLTDLDRRVLAMVDGVANAVCPSFTDSHEQVQQALCLLQSAAPPMVIAKVESPVGVANMARIADDAGGLMLCRGDLRAFSDEHTIDNALAARMRDIVRSRRKALALATGYFASMVDGGVLDQRGSDGIQRALALQPQYFIVNETSFSPAWYDIASTALDLAACC